MYYFSFYNTFGPLEQKRGIECFVRFKGYKGDKEQVLLVNHGGYFKTHKLNSKKTDYLKTGISIRGKDYDNNFFPLDDNLKIFKPITNSGFIFDVIDNWEPIYNVSKEKKTLIVIALKDVYKGDHCCDIRNDFSFDEMFKFIKNKKVSTGDTYLRIINDFTKEEVMKKLESLGFEKRNLIRKYKLKY